MAVRSGALIWAGAILLATCPAPSAVVAAPASAATLEAVQRASLETAAGVGSGDLRLYATASFASAHGGRMNVDFVSGVFVQSAGRVHLLTYDRASKSFRQNMSFEISAIPGVALVTGPFDRKQLQIQTESGVVVCNFDKLIGGGKVAEQVYDGLIVAGVRTFDSSGLIRAIKIPGPTVITIYLPSR